ncbi:MAG: hypothetical protein AAF224_06790 [Pseudomonadota bacterium]
MASVGLMWVDSLLIVRRSMRAGQASAARAPMIVAACAGPITKASAMVAATCVVISGATIAATPDVTPGETPEGM